GTPLAAGLAWGYFKWMVVDTSDTPYIGTAVVLFAISAVIELVSEPCFVLSQLQLEFRSRAAFESAAITIRCVLTFLFVLLASSSYASIIAFALGQLAFSSVLSSLYIYNALSSEEGRRRQYSVLTIQRVWPDDDSSMKSGKLYFVN